MFRVSSRIALNEKTRQNECVVISELNNFNNDTPKKFKMLIGSEQSCSKLITQKLSKTKCNSVQLKTQILSYEWFKNNNKIPINVTLQITKVRDKSGRSSYHIILRF